MAAAWIEGLGQTIAGATVTALTFGQVDEVKKWTVDGAKKVADNTEKTWGADGAVTKVCESIPGVGYIASAGHAIAGDEQRALRAAASSTRSVFLTAGIVAGVGVAGPSGAMTGAAIGRAVGRLAEKNINRASGEKYQTDADTTNEFDAKNLAEEICVSAAQAGKRSTHSLVTDKPVSPAFKVLVRRRKEY